MRATAVVLQVLLASACHKAQARERPAPLGRIEWARLDTWPCGNELQVTAEYPSVALSCPSLKWSAWTALPDDRITRFCVDGLDLSSIVDVAKNVVAGGVDPGLADVLERTYRGDLIHKTAFDVIAIDLRSDPHKTICWRVDDGEFEQAMRDAREAGAFKTR
jgi:hypothetical protein